MGFIACRRTGGGPHGLRAHKAGLQCIAFAEVDKTRWDGVLGKKGWEQAAGYTDWRKVFEKHGKELDVVFVATPDHTHFAPSMTAVSMGIHCYTEKPLTWSVREAQLLAAAYAKNPKVVTQQGNQGHAGNGWRLAYEYVKAGAVGDIEEFHTWTNRPIWPQGGDRPEGSDPVPETLDWEAWIGAAPMRPYVSQGRQGNGPYHAFNWRGVVDFGSGALGDMACHTTDGIYAIMNPGYAATAEPIIMTGPVKDQWPAGMVVKSTYRAKDGRPGFTTFWYEGKKEDGTPFMPETPEELKADNRKLPRTGNLIIGTKGKMLVNGDYWEHPADHPGSAAQGVRPSAATARTFSRPSRGVLHGLQGREAPGVQPVQLRATRVPWPPTSSLATSAPARERSSNSTRPARSPAIRRSTTWPGASLARVGVRWR